MLQQLLHKIIFTVYAANPLPAPTIDSPVKVDIGTFINGIPGKLIMIAGILFVGALFYGGIIYMTSLGNTEGAEKGKNTILFAIYGIITVVIAGAAVALLQKYFK